MVVAFRPLLVAGDLRRGAVVAGGLAELLLVLEDGRVLVVGFSFGTVDFGDGCLVAVDGGRVVEPSVPVERDEVAVVPLGGALAAGCLALVRPDD